MSTKSTILLTKANEHWYNDCNAAYYEDTSTQEAIVLEFDKEHVVEADEDGTRIIIEEGTDLYKAIKKLWRDGERTLQEFNGYPGNKDGEGGLNPKKRSEV